MIPIKEVRYKITGFFGIEDPGTIINSILITKEKMGYETRGILYHPKVQGECPSFEICVLHPEGYWTSLSDDSYVNVSMSPKTLETGMFGKTFKFKRSREKEGVE